MPDDIKHIGELITRKLLGSLAPEEEQELDRWAAVSPANHRLLANLLDKQKLAQHLDFYQDAEAIKDDAGRALLAGISGERSPVRPAHRVHFLRKWGWVAASVILLAGIGAYLWRANKKNTEQAAVAAKTIDHKSGKEGAILTLADGRQVVLDSLGNGIVATQNGTQVLLKNGQLAYGPTGGNTGELVYNTMSTPKGRQFSIVLPDGTHVWLNAASTLRYPTVFTGNKRTVEINGEAYFEVVKNKEMPFTVMAGDNMITVLGTHFNINAYGDENNISTTLLEGSVAVSHAGKEHLLKPGQQAIYTVTTRNMIVLEADTNQVMGWKNGFFEFDNTGLPVIMRLISRWYDVDIEYTAAYKDIQLAGGVSRRSKLEDVLDLLAKNGVKTRIEGKKIIVGP